MGSDFDTWNDATGPIYMGANSGWEVIWFVVAAGLCVAAIVAGSLHEHESYKKVSGRDIGK